MNYTPEIIDIPLPSMGGKCWLLNRKGMFILEPGPGTIRTLAVTHAGSGTIEAIDGIPNCDGFFPDEHLTEPLAFTAQEIDALDKGDGYGLISAHEKLELHKAWGARRGRPLYKASPAVMGSWMLDGGFIHGLTIRATGDNSAVNSFASIVWMPFKARVKP